MKLFRTKSLRWGISILLCSACAEDAPVNTHERPDSVLQRRESVESPREGYLLACDSCNYKLAEVTATVIPKDSRVITYHKATVIEFFSLAKRKDWYDSLDDSHQTYYRTIDQYGMYMTVLKPLVNAAGINIVDGIPAGNILLFEDGDDSHFVDIRPFRAKDGVLMWTPGKKPVFWTAKATTNNCPDSTWFNCYFGR